MPDDTQHDMLTSELTAERERAIYQRGLDLIGSVLERLRQENAELRRELAALRGAGS